MRVVALENPPKNWTIQKKQKKQQQQQQQQLCKTEDSLRIIRNEVNILLNTEVILEVLFLKLSKKPSN